MNLLQLQALLAQGESERLELKRSTGQRTEAARTICALLNGQGGLVVFGADDQGRLVGQVVTPKTHEDVIHEIRKIEPPAFPDMETIPLDNGLFLLVLRVSGGGGPYTFDGRPYLRQGPTTRVMPRELFERLILERMHASHRWENALADGFGFEDLDHQEIIRTIEEAIRRQRLDDPGTRDIPELLTGLGLMNGKNILKGSVVLFGKPERLLPSFPQCLLKMARFRGADKTEFLDNRQEVGNAFDLYRRAQRFLRDHLPVAGRIVPNLFEREDDPVYPTEALREALANALCHRDYGVGSGSVSISIFDDRLEIASTGILPFGLTIEDLQQPHPSRPWNPLIANVFYKRGIIDAWGRGTLKIAQLISEAGLVAPEFECRGGEVVVRFRPTRYVPPSRIGHELSPIQRQILKALAEAGPSSLSTISSLLQPPVPDRTLQENLAMLRSLLLIDGHGRGRGARWMLKGVH